MSIHLNFHPDRNHVFKAKISRLDSCWSLKITKSNEMFGDEITLFYPLKVPRSAMERIADAFNVIADVASLVAEEAA